MALTNDELQDIIARLSPDERKQLLSQLGRQVEIDKISDPYESIPTESNNSKVYCCPVCGSSNYKKIGVTAKGMRWILPTM